MNYYCSNLKLLFEQQPGLVNLLEGLREDGLEVVKAKNGSATIKVKGRILHSLYDPQQEARELVAKVDLSKDLFVVLGFGLGYHLFELLRGINCDSTVIVFEASPAIFKKALTEMDLKKVLGFPQMRFSVCEDHLATREHLQDWIKTGFRGLALIEHPPSIRLFPGYYSQIKTILFDTIDQKFQGLRARTTFGSLWTRNFILNLAQMITTPGIKSLFNRFQEIPAFIIGAGPSLEKNIDKLSLARGKAVLIATDTALKPLIDSGIIPDIVVSCDAQDKTMGDFEGLREMQAVLAAATLVYPEVLRVYKGPRLLFTIARLRYTEDGEEIATLPPLARWCEEITEPKGYLQAGGSVSTVAFDLARNMGCNPIIFVGQDLAFTDKKLYADGVDHIRHYKYMREYMRDYMERILGEKEGSPTFEARYREAFEKGIVYQEYIKRRRLMKVPGIDGKDLLTNEALYTYLRWFEDAISKLPDRLFINATEGGANITGTKVMGLSEVIDEYCQVLVPVKEILEKAILLYPSVDRMKVVSIIDGVIDMLDELSGIHSELGRIPSCDERLAMEGRLDELIGRLSFLDILSKDGVDKRFQGLKELSVELKSLFEETLSIITNNQQLV